MAWSEHQHAQLRAMGLRLWSAPAALEQSPAEAPAVEAGRVAGPAVPAVAAPVNRAPAPVPQAALASTSPLASLGWPELRAAVAQCQACGLCESRTQTVFGVGHEQAQWMVVGEAPGENEDRQGEPVVGAAGQLLDRAAAKVQKTEKAKKAAEARRSGSTSPTR